jgi:hypothetical protein
MGLPFVIDVAIGIIFIYLILSLLSSEIQELLTTVLQWRAKHLKQSIEVLLAGGTGTDDEERVKDLVNQVYSHPLLRNVNQEAKGLAGQIRGITGLLLPDNRKGTFFGKGQSTGPSYIASETFATSLMERLGIGILTDKLTEVRLEKFAQRIVGAYSVDPQGLVAVAEDAAIAENWQKGRIRLIAEREDIPNLNMDENFRILVEDYADILQDFRSEQATLETCIERMEESLTEFISAWQTLDPGKRFVSRLNSFKASLFGRDNERAYASGGLRPSLLEIAELVNQTSATYKEISAAYDAISNRAKPIADVITAALQEVFEAEQAGQTQPIQYSDLNNEQRRLFEDRVIRQLIDAGQITERDRQLYDDYMTYQSIQKIIGTLPPTVRESLSSLAKRAQTRAQYVGNELSQFRQEVAVWFDRSMDRAGGVYKRNAKGVALILGFILASITNSDAFHIVSRLSSDESLRQVIAEEAVQVESNLDRSASLKDQLREIKIQTDTALDDLTIPVGWRGANLTRQFQCNLREDNPEDLGKACLNAESLNPVTAFIGMVSQQPWKFSKMVVGWLISGLAISMGAPFWFDILSKFINVRNSGRRPAPAVAQPEPTNAAGDNTKA